MQGIRRFEVADAVAVHLLAADAPEAAQWSLWSYRELVECGYESWVAIYGGGLNGFIVTRTVSGEAEILNVAVAAGCRHSGIGGALLDTALRAFCLAGVRRVFLEVRASNVAAMAFYRKRGFAEVGTRAGYYPASGNSPAEGAVLMERIVTD